MLLPGWLRRTLSLVIVTLPLTGCVTGRPEGAVPSVIVRCGSVADIPPAAQAQAAKEIDALPPDSVIAGEIIPDWLRMRDEARACRKGRK